MWDQIFSLFGGMGGGGGGGGGMYPTMTGAGKGMQQLGSQMMNLGVGKFGPQPSAPSFASHQPQPQQAPPPMGGVDQSIIDNALMNQAVRDPQGASPEVRAYLDDLLLASNQNQMFRGTGGLY